MTGALKFMSILVLACLVFASNGEAAQKVLFDNAHGERFQIGDKGPLQLSGLAEVFQGAGLQTAVIDQPFTDATLSGAGALVISGAFTPLLPSEVEAVARFLQNGGKLVVMLHIAPPLRSILDRLDVAYTNGVILEHENVIDGDPLRFKVNRLEVHPVLTGLSDFSLYGVWGVINRTESARVIASTGPSAWIDLNQDKVQTKDETASIGVAVAGDLGKGSFLVFGDDAIFQNKFLEGNNKTLAANLAAWLK
ncbi:MAG: DUF4350 domain-containing protein [Geobacter sp.]|nr:MAG: DUF4350 domain-containing protein [Geobacter sp.]